MINSKECLWELQKSVIVGVGETLKKGSRYVGKQVDDSVHLRIGKFTRTVLVSEVKIVKDCGCSKGR